MGSWILISAYNSFCPLPSDEIILIKFILTLLEESNKFLNVLIVECFIACLPSEWVLWYVVEITD